MAYFLPNDRPYRAEVVDSMKVAIRQIQAFFAQEMQSHGQGNLTFRFETDAQGEPLVHRVDGEHSDAHYLETGTGVVQMEIETALGERRPIQLFVLDNSLNAIPWGNGRAAGVAKISQGPGRRTYGTVVVPGFFSWITIAHELGHTFGLEHDFRDNDFIMSYGPYRRPRLSACAAELLATHPYLNPGIDLIPEPSPSTISLLSPERYPAGSMSIPIQVRIGDFAGPHQVHLTLPTPAPHFAAGQSETKACRSLSGEGEAVVEFEYDGLIPSNDLTSLSHPIVHPGVIWATDEFGWATGVGFALHQHSDRHITTLETVGAGTSLAFLPDGSLASASADTVRLWDLGTRETAASIGLGAPVRAVAVSPDGVILASEHDGLVKLWEVATGTHTATLEGQQGPDSRYRSIAFSPDGKTLAVVSGGSTAMLWDVGTGANYADLDHDDPVTSVAFSPDGTSLATSARRVVTLWDPATGAPTAVLEGHTYWVGAVAFSPDGTTLASLSGAYGLVRLWDVETQRTVATIENTIGGRAMAFSRDGATLVCASGYLVNLWDVGTKVRIDSLAHGDWVRVVAFSPDGKTLATGTRRKGLELWDATEWLKPRAHGLVEISGDGQEGPPGAILKNPLVVKVRDQYGNGLAGVPVTFAVTEGDGRLSGRYTVENTETDDDGRAEGVLILGTGPDTTTVEARLPKADPVRFRAVTVKPHTLRMVSGDGQEGQPGALLPGSLVVEVRDVDGNPLEGVPVTFAVLVGGGTLSAPTDTTDENGRAATILTLGNQPRRNIVVVRVAELKPVIFYSAVGQAIPKTLTKLSGDKQEAPAWGGLPEPLVVLVRDQNDDPVKGALVAFAVTAGEGSLSSATVPTDEKGRAATTLTLGSRPGPYTVEATVTGLDPVTFTAIASATTDFDGDGETGFSDFFLFADAFGGSDPRFDLDGSGSVDFGDFFLFADHFGNPARGKLLALARVMIGLPDGPQLQQNAPNPFNSETLISWFQLRPGLARVEVFALTGQRVAVLHQGPKKAGVHRVHWDGRDDRGRTLASGVYLYRLVTTENVQTRKLTLLR